MAKYFGEPPLVMVEALLCLVINATNVDNDVACVEDSGVARALHLCASLVSIQSLAWDREMRTSIAVGRGLAQEEHGERLVAMERAIVGPNDLGSLSLLRGGLLREDAGNGGEDGGHGASADV